LSKIPTVLENFRILSKFGVLSKFRFLGKIWSFFQNLDLLRKLSSFLKISIS